MRQIYQMSSLTRASVAKLRLKRRVEESQNHGIAKTATCYVGIVDGTTLQGFVMRVKIDITESRNNRLLLSYEYDVREVESRSGALRIAKSTDIKIVKGQYLWVYFLEADKLYQFTPSQLK